MTASLYQGGHGYTPVVGQNPHGKLPHPPIQAMKQGSKGPVLSDLQNMMKDEQERHMDTYRYANGHNDHGLGQ